SPAVYFVATVSDSICGSNWNAEMSNGNGQFGGGDLLWSGFDNFDHTYSSYWYLIMPPNFGAIGECFNFKLTQTSYPYLTFTDTFCFPFDTCPGFIYTLQPPSALDSAGYMCAGSWIDVPFYSTGLYNTYNTYYAQLF